VNSQKKSYKSFHCGGKSNNMYNFGTDMHSLGTNMHPLGTNVQSNHIIVCLKKYVSCLLLV